MSYDFCEKYLRSFPGDIAVVEQESPLILASLPELSLSFQKVTGYQLHFVRPGTNMAECTAVFPIQSGYSDSQSPVCVMGISRSLTSVSLIPERDVEQLARSLADMISESHQWQVALRQREAELAANVQLTFHDQKNHGLAQLLESILSYGAKTIHCNAAALYLLDHETSVLKMRSVWGLPEDRLTDPPRQLSTALADLEAMLGHAVVLNEDEFLAEQWNAPENFRSSICVPVASSTSIHGTLWCYADSYVEFDASAINLLEIVAGRIACELERRTLLRESHDGMILKRQLTDAEHFMQTQLPRTTSAKKNVQWQIAGATSHSKPLAATFYDWQDISQDKSLFAIVSTAESIPSVEAQMRMVMLQTEIKNLGRYKHSAKQAVQELEDIAFSQQAEKKPFEMLYGIIEKEKSRIRLSYSGSFVIFRYRAHGENGYKSPTIQRIDHEYREARPELGGFRMLPIDPGDCLIAIHIPDDSHHRNDRILNALYSKSFLRDKVMPALNDRVEKISELFATQTQEAISGANVTVVTIKNVYG